MKIKSIKANVHEIYAEVPLLKHPLKRRIVFCEVETDDGITGTGLTAGSLPWAVVTALTWFGASICADVKPVRLAGAMSNDVLLLK